MTRVFRWVMGDHSPGYRDVFARFRCELTRLLTDDDARRRPRQGPGAAWERGA